MKCRECGTLLPDEANFCFHCGVAIDENDKNKKTDNQESDNIDNTQTSSETDGQADVSDNAESDKVESVDVVSEVEENADTVSDVENDKSENADAVSNVEENVYTVRYAENDKSESEDVVSDTDTDAVEEDKIEGTDRTSGAESDAHVEKDKIVDADEARDAESDNTESTDEESDTAESAKEVDNTKEDNSDADSDEEADDEKSINVTAIDEDYAERNSGFSIMTNPDYVPPVVEEEKPFFEEHINYQEIHREKMEKIEKIAMKVGTGIGIAVAAAVIGFFGFKYFMSYQYDSAMKEAQTLIDNGSYDESISTLREAMDIYGADKTQIAFKMKDAYVAKGDISAARDVLLEVYNITEDADLLNESKVLKEQLENGDKDDSSGDTSDTEDSKDTQEESKDAEYQMSVDKINDYIEKKEYDTALSECANLLTLDKADERGYILTAQVYAAKNDFANAVKTLEDGVDKLNQEAVTVSAQYTENLNKYKETLEGLNKYNEFCVGLYKAVSTSYSNNIVNDVVTLITSEDYSKMFANAETTYYTESEGFVDSIESGKGMAVYNNGYIYFGNFLRGKRAGQGLYITAQKDSSGLVKYNTYKGRWKNDLPEGEGVLKYVEGFGTDKVSTSITSGTFAGGYENGRMTRTKTVAGTKWGKMEYDVVNGQPQPMVDKKGNPKKDKNGQKILGYHYFNEKPTYVVTLVDGVLFGVDGLGLNLSGK